MNVVLVLLMVVNGAVSPSKSTDRENPSYEVSEVLAVRSLSEFECRLKDYPYTKSARFRVKIRSLSGELKVSQPQAKAVLARNLKEADRIWLKNIRFRNYFRLTADVVIDGRDAAAELTARKLVEPASGAIPLKEPSKTDVRGPLRLPGAVRQQSMASKRPARSTVKRVTLDSLMETTVDLSEIDEETTFQEAMDILTDSVRPRLPLVILWNDLENNAFIDKEMPVGLGGFGSVPLKQALKLILLSVSRAGGLKPELAFEGRVITIGTQRGLLQKSIVKSYSVEDLTQTSYAEDDERNSGAMDDLMNLVGGRSSSRSSRGASR